MKPPNQKQAASEIIDVLADLFGSAPKAIRLAKRRSRMATTIPSRCPATVSSCSTRIWLPPGHWPPLFTKSSNMPRPMQTEGLPLIVVPFMGPVGRDLCEKSSVSWFDLSGNAKIVAPGLRIWIEGRPNKYSDRGRPPNVFASKSSRIARQLLLQPQRFQTQAELARQTGLGDGYVSKIVRRLEQEQYLDANDVGAVRPRDPNLLLDAWHGAYDFSRHRIIKGHVPARSGDELLHEWSNSFPTKSWSMRRPA